MGMNISSGEGEEQLNSTINTTPLVDVMLVLLIVFLIAVPVVAKVKKVALPNVENVVTQSKPKDIVITVDTEGLYYWGPELLSSKEELLNRLKVEARRSPQPEVHIRGDKNTRYEHVGRVVNYVQKVGIVRVGFLSLPRNETTL
jgi:biopolymer transport protein ExbD